MGCHLKVDETNGYSVTGNTCPRGAEYGYEEATAPKRMVTSTVRIFFTAIQRESDKQDGKNRLSEETTSGSRDVPDLLPLVSYFNRGSRKIEARLPAKTSAPIPKEKIMDVMKAINAVTVYAPIHIGDIIVPDVAGTGANLVATRSMESV
jgi:CxxC motif-containing protein